MTEMDEDKRFLTYSIEWDDRSEEYVFFDHIYWENDRLLEFDTYKDFLTFMQALTEEEKLFLGEWRLEDTETGEFVTISDGVYDEVNFISMNISELDQTGLLKGEGA